MKPGISNTKRSYAISQKVLRDSPLNSSVSSISFSSKGLKPAFIKTPLRPYNQHTINKRAKSNIFFYMSLN